MAVHDLTQTASKASMMEAQEEFDTSLLLPLLAEISDLLKKIEKNTRKDLTDS